MTLKTYTVKDQTHPSSAKNHKLVRSAYKRGLTGIKITSERGQFQRVGWYLEAYQIPKLFLGYDATEAEKRINLIEKVEIAPL